MGKSGIEIMPIEWRRRNTPMRMGLLEGADQKRTGLNDSQWPSDDWPKACRYISSG